MTKTPRKPRMIKLDSNSTKSVESETIDKSGDPRKPRSYSDLSNLVIEEFGTEFDRDEHTTSLSSQPVKSGFSWWAILLAGLGGIISLSIGLALDQMIRELFARQDWLGWLATSLVALAVLALAIIILKEIWAVSRLNTISRIRSQADEIIEKDLSKDSKALIGALNSIYSDRPDLANAKSKYNSQSDTLFDSKDHLILFEQTYLKALDDQARILVMQSAKRVSVVTAVSPRAIVDLLYVLMENTRLIRRISQLYGGRPGTLGFWKLTRNVLGHLAVTGTIAAGDSLIQQLVGHGIAARLSAKLGEGIVNGLLTARIGLSAIDQARPMGFHGVDRPGISEYFSALISSNKENTEED